MGDALCVNCGHTIRLINYALGEKWMHVKPRASFPTERKGSAWWYCRQVVATPDSSLLAEHEARP